MIHVFEEWHKVIIHPCWHSQRERWVMDTLLILLQHSRTESLHPVNSGGADCPPERVRTWCGRKPMPESVTGANKESGLWPCLLPQCFSSLSPSPTLTLCSCISSTLATHAHSCVHLPHIAEVSFSTI